MLSVFLCYTFIMIKSGEKFILMRLCKKLRLLRFRSGCAADLSYTNILILAAAVYAVTLQYKPFAHVTIFLSPCAIFQKFSNFTCFG